MFVTGGPKSTRKYGEVEGGKGKGQGEKNWTQAGRRRGRDNL